MKKGQGSLEYLMTYGWVLLVIVTVGGVLFGMGVLNPTTYAVRQCHFRYFTYMDEELQGSKFSIDLINGPQALTVTGISVNGIAADSISAAPVILSGARFKVEADIPGLFASGAFRYPVKISYNVLDGIQGKSDEGTCTGSAG